MIILLLLHVTNNWKPLTFYNFENIELCLWYFQFYSICLAFPNYFPNIVQIDLVDSVWGFEHNIFVAIWFDSLWISWKVFWMFLNLNATKFYLIFNRSVVVAIIMINEMIIEWIRKTQI